MFRTLTVLAALVAAVGQTVATDLENACGSPPEPFNTTAGASNVLIIGDSISMGCCWGGSTTEPIGYGLYVKSYFEAEGLATVQHNGGWEKEGQAGPTTKGMQCIDYWLGNQTALWDVCSFNFGLHDLAADSEHVPIPEYAANIASIQKRIAAKCRRHTFVTTTPVPDVKTSPARLPMDVIAYNDAARGALAPGSNVTDLWQWVVDRCGGAVNYTACDIQRHDNVHYLGPGRSYTGLRVAMGIMQALGTVNATEAA